MVGGHAPRDGQHPGAQVVRVPEATVAAERTQERLLVRVLRVTPEQAAKLTQDRVLVLFVERFERRNMHESHHLL